MFFCGRWWVNYCFHCYIYFFITIIRIILNTAVGKTVGYWVTAWLDVMITALILCSCVERSKVILFFFIVLLHYSKWTLSYYCRSFNIWRKIYALGRFLDSPLLSKVVIKPISHFARIRICHSESAIICISVSQT